MEEENTKTTTPESSEQESDELVNSDQVTEETVDDVDDMKKQSEDIEIIDEEEVSEHKELEKEIDEITKEKNELYDRLLRIQAEYDNYKRRTQKERVAERKYKAQDLATELLPVMDNFERALQVEQTEATKNLIEGISMVYNQLKEAMKSQGIDEIETVGKPFDPNLHHAAMQVEDEEQESNIVVEELQKGYILNDRVIRPAMVKVNK